jgi:arginase
VASLAVGSGCGGGVRREIVNVSVIQVPYMLGDDRHAAAGGPSAILAAGLVSRLAAVGAEAKVASVDRGTGFADTATASRAVNRRLAETVRESVGAGRLPVVLAGSCDAAIGVVGGLGDPELGIVWLDAHGDFNTPETTLSGFFAGMSLAIVTGDCYRSYWSEITDSSPVPHASTLLIGARDFDPAERERVERSGMTTAEWRNGRGAQDVEETLEAFAARARRVYVHLDLDVLDPSVAPGVVDQPVPGGMSLSDVDAILGDVAGRFSVRAFTVATFNPERDRDDRTRDAIIHIIERFVERLP